MTTPIPFVTLDPPAYGAVVEILPGVRRVIAENPNKFTYRGTGTYIVGEAGGDVVVIDPGPRLDSHRDALVTALRGCTVRAILVTHCHADHSPLAAWLREETGAPTVAFGPHGVAAADLSDDDEEWPAPDPSPDTPPVAETPVEETVDLDFVPDVVCADGDVAVEIGPLTFRGVHTPGHTSNHLCFALEQQGVLFTGDHVMGWSTTVVAPPDGDMAAYLDSLRKVAGRNDSVLVPTHGSPVTDPKPLLTALIAHRLEREQQILAQVRSGTSRIPAIVASLYADVRTELHRAAGRSVRAHLLKLADEGLVVADGREWRPV